jgi:nicotinamide-nucleotide amidase
MYNRNHISKIKELLLKRNETVAFAESVTSGHLQAAMSLAEGASQFFQGGITTYNITQKTKLLHVNALHALQCNCVSEQVSQEMALQALTLFSSTWAVGITGYAAPVPELGIHELFAFYSIATGNTILKTGMVRSNQKDVLEVQLYYTDEVLKEFSESLRSVQIQH